ncbi:MAG: hypothetical protein M3680_28735 [Myxococcota bacterium]|nr:hypothetical protein [Myxococcota bacterium]
MWGALLVLVLGLGLGCGRIGYDARPGDADADDGSVDAILDGPLRDAIMPGACGATALINDPFDDGVAAPAFTLNTSGGLTASESNGRFSVQFPGSVSASNDASYRSVTAYPVAGLCATVEVVQRPVNGAAIFAQLRTAQLGVALFAHDDIIELRTEQSSGPGSGIVVRATLPLDLVAHRFWRLRQVGTTTLWETSADGSQFVTHAMVDGFFTASTCLFELGAGAPVDVTAGGAAAFESATAFGP